MHESHERWGVRVRTGHLPEDIDEFLVSGTESTSSSDGGQVSGWHIHNFQHGETGKSINLVGLIVELMSNLLFRVDSKELKLCSVFITLVDVTDNCTNSSSGFAAFTTPFSVTPLEGEESTGGSKFSFTRKLSVEFEVSHTVDRSISSILTFGGNCGSKCSSILETNTVSFDEKLLIGQTGIEWKLSAVIFSNTDGIDPRVEDPHANFSIFSFKLVSSSSGCTIS
jgi:hypothetical protein